MMAFLVTMPISIRMPITTGIETAALASHSAATTPPIASGSEPRIVKEWNTEPNSRISTTSTSISPVDMAVAKPANTSPMISASPVSWMRVPAGISLTAGSSQTAARPSPSSLPAAMSAPMTTRRSRLKRAIEDGPCPKRIAATDESGTLTPEGVGTGSSPITEMSLRAASSSCTRIGIWRSPSVNFARLASMSPIVAMRSVSATSAVETPSSASRARSGSMIDFRPVERGIRRDGAELAGRRHLALDPAGLLVQSRAVGSHDAEGQRPARRDR